MKVAQTFHVSEFPGFVLAMLDDMHKRELNKLDYYNDVIADAAERCRPEQPVSQEIFEDREFFALLRDKAAATVITRFSDEELTNLAWRCRRADGAFAMDKKLDAATRALGDGTWDGDYAGDAGEQARGLLPRLAALVGLDRYAFCDMLRLLNANDALTATELRARVTERARLLGGSR